MMAGLSILSEPPNNRSARQLLDRYYSELAARLSGGFDVDAEADPTVDFAPPFGAFLVARIDGRAVGCGAVRPLAVESAEIKRMWVDPTFRGSGIGRSLLCTLESVAVDLAYRRLRLDTAAELSEALSLYRRAGYAEIARYNDNPYASHWLEKTLPDPKPELAAHSPGGATEGSEWIHTGHDGQGSNHHRAHRAGEPLCEPL